ncbi:MAG: DUF308 domain-containing protein [Clostridia bacterium]|nr:DUF308 domain-containing protein [Clostridia bacterium]
MKHFLAVERTKTIILALAMLVFGILFIILPQASFDVMITVLACILIVVGLAWLVGYFIYFKEQTSSSGFVNGVLYIGLGAIMLYIPSVYIALIGFALSFIGVQYIGYALDSKRLGEVGWWKDLIYGIVEAVIGIILVVLRYSSASQNAIMIYLGISLIVDSLFIFAMLAFVKKAVKTLTK